MKRFDTIQLPQVKLSYKQKVILDVLKDEFHGTAFGPEILEESEDIRIKEFSINQITWHFLRLRESGLVESEKKSYKGRILNEYKITPYIMFDVIDIL